MSVMEFEMPNLSLAVSSLTSQTLFYCVGVEKESLVQSNTTIGNFRNEIVT